MLKIYGHSDDTLCVEGGPPDCPDDADTCAADGVHVEVNIGGQLIVRGFYCVSWNQPGTWCLAVQQVQEDIAIPWAVRIEPEHGYSCAVLVDCPPETHIAIRKVSQ